MKKQTKKKMNPVTQVLKDWRSAGVLGDRKEYDKKDLKLGLPHLTKSQIDELYYRLHKKKNRSKTQ